MTLSEAKAEVKSIHTYMLGLTSRLNTLEIDSEGTEEYEAARLLMDAGLLLARCSYWIKKLTVQKRKGNEVK